MSADRDHRPGCTLSPEHSGECLVPKPGKALRAMRTGRSLEPGRRVQTDETIVRRDGG